MAQTLININGDVRDAASINSPADRTFRGAWQFSGDAVEVDMVKAKVIHKDNLRRDRQPMLDELDVAYMKALEQGGDTASIAAQKQALRDITDDVRLDAATTPEELVSLTVDVLLS